MNKDLSDKMAETYCKKTIAELSLTPRKRYYLAGPMSHRADSDYNYPEFNRAALILREEGYDIMNPAEWGLRGKSRREIMEECISMLLLCDGVICLYGWTQSPGARAEVMLARELGFTIEQFRWFEDRSWAIRETSESVLIEILGV